MQLFICNAPLGKYCGDNTQSDADFLDCPVDSVCMGGSSLPSKDGMETDDLQVTGVGAVRGE